MANEVVIQGVVGGKQQATSSVLTVGTEVVATVLGTDDVMIVLKAGLSPALGSVIISNLIRQLNDRLDELNLT